MSENQTFRYRSGPYRFLFISPKPKTIEDANLLDFDFFFIEEFQWVAGVVSHPNLRRTVKVMVW